MVFGDSWSAAPLPLIGRDVEAAILDAALRSAAAGHGQLVVVEGEAGIGKSRLLADGLDRARAGGFEVLAGYADEVERHRPFAAIAEALRLRTGTEDPERAAITALLDGHLANGQPGDPAGLVYRVCEAVEIFVERVTQRRPTVLVIEDAHWADPATLTCLAGLARVCGRLALLLVVTARPVPRSTELTALLATFDRRGARRIQVPSLTDGEVPELVRAAAGRKPGPNLRELLARAGGNPLFVLELLAVVRDDQILQSKADVVEIDRQRISVIPPLTVLHRVSQLSGATREMLRSASVLGTAFDVSGLSLLTGRTAIELAAPLEEARVAGVVVERGDRLAFRHELVRDALYTDLPASLRQAMHRQFADRLSAAGGAPTAVAEHLLRGARAGDLDAARSLRDAALAITSQAPIVAVDLIDHALSLVAVGSPLHGKLAADRALALMAAGRVEAGEQACRTVLDLGLDREREALLRRMLIRSMMFSGRATETVPVIEQALVMPGLSVRERAGFRGAASYLHLHLHDYARALAFADESVAVARESDDEFALSEALNAEAQALGFSGRVSDAADTGLEAFRVLGNDVPPIGAQSVASTAGLMLMVSGRVDEGKQLLRRGRQINDEAGAPAGVALHHVNLADGLYLCGEWDDAIAEIEATAGLVRDGPALPASSEPLLAIIAVHCNDPRAAQAHLDATDAALRAGGTSTRWHRRDLAAALLADLRGQPEVALAELGALWGQLASAGMGFAYPEVGPELARRLAAAGRAEAVNPIADTLDACAADNPAVASIRGAALICRGVATSDVATVLDALAAYRAGSRPFDLALGCEDAAGLLAAAGQPAEAAEVLREALAIHESLGARRCALRVVAGLRELGVRRGPSGRRGASASGWDALTASERAVVTLLAERLSNGEIAERLFLSRRTVETHVSHALAKTGLRSRVELAAEAGPRGFGAGGR